MAKKYLDDTGLGHLWEKIKGKFLSLSGGTLTGKLDAASNKYYEPSNDSGIDMNNSDISGVNGIYFNDATAAFNKGIHFPNGSGWDTFKMLHGIPYVQTARQKNNAGPDLQMYFAKPYENGTVNPDVRPLVDQCRANRLAFLPADQIIIEITTDGGETWVDGGFTDAQKAAVFATQGNIKIPLLNGAKSTQCGLRVTLTGMKYNVPDGTAETEKYQYWNKDHVISQERYFNVREWWFWISSNNDHMRVTIEAATGANPNTWLNYFNKDFGMSGWSGSDWVRAGNAQTFGGGVAQTTNKWNWRLTFWSKMVPGDTAFRSNTIQVVLMIRCYGDNVWGTPNPLMHRDHMYTWDMNQNVTFPAKVTATGGFSGNLTGNASTATTASNAESVNGHTVAKDVPSNAKFTDTIPNGFASISIPNDQIVATAPEDSFSLYAGDNIDIALVGNGAIGISAQDTTYSTVSKTAAGLCPKLPNETTTTKYLRQDGTWVAPLGTLDPSTLDSLVSDVQQASSDASDALSAVGSLGDRVTDIEIAIPGINNKVENLETAVDGVGTYKTGTISSSLTSIANGTATNVSSISLPKGVWIVSGQVAYNAGGTAANYRACYIGSSSTGGQYARVQIPGCASGNTILEATAIISLSATATVYLATQQGSGGALTFVPSMSRFQAVRII